MTFTVILIGLCINIVASELLGLSTLAAKAVVKWAVKRHIPEGMQREVEDEWLSHIEGMTGGPKLLQLYQAATIALKAAPRLGREARDTVWEAMWVELDIEVKRLKVNLEHRENKFLSTVRWEGGTLKFSMSEAAKLEEFIHVCSRELECLENKQQHLKRMLKKL